jgi:glutamate-ammonia-ligase adenylyltransferase
MLPGSDLDLVLVYDHDPGGHRQRGGAAVAGAVGVLHRLAPQMVSAITTPGAEGTLWEVDMRLRPSGSKGPVAVRLESFRRYHAAESWNLGAHGADPRRASSPARRR